MPLMHLSSNYRHLFLTIVLSSSGVYRAISALVLGLKPVPSGVLAERARKYGSTLHRQDILSAKRYLPWGSNPLEQGKTFKVIKFYF